MSVIRDLAEGALYLLPVGVGAGLVYVFGRDRTAANEHDLSDYHDEPTAELAPRRHAPAPIPAQRRPWAEMNGKPGLDELRERITAGLKSGRPEVLGPRMAVTERDILPPALASVDAGTPPLARNLMIEHAVPTLSDAAVRGIAAEMLQEIAAEQQARAGIRPVVDHWAVLDGSCYDDCPACARDMTGSFAVLAVA